ncbi:unnamed protein product [Phytomonas sp. EM1]|nr:unnamed protein product [Phytomonas sp. EM1]|eukprot:CCW62042.1 unnamed protein product [Phytomonas sp. isolate EM1]
MSYKISTTRLCALAMLLLLLGSISLTEAIVFKLQPNSRRCFANEAPSNTYLRIAYKLTPAPDQKLLVSLLGPDDVAVWTDAKDEAFHQSYNSVGGNFHLCFLSKVERYDNGAPLERVVTLKMDNELSESVENDPTSKLKPIEDQLRKIEYTIFGIHNEYLYFKEKEAEMRSTNEHMTSKVVWISVFVIIIFLVFSYFQLRHLKSYFRKKRMID